MNIKQSKQSKPIKQLIRYYPAWIDLSQITINAEYLHELDKDVIAAAERVENLILETQRELREDELAIWFQGKIAAGMLGNGDVEFTPLAKNVNVFDFEQAAESADETKQPEDTIAMIVPVSALELDLTEISKLKHIAAQRFFEMPNVPSYRAMFNRYVAPNKDNCMITMQGNKNIGFTIVDSLCWNSTESAFGFILNDTKELWQVSILSSRAIAACKDIAMNVGDLVGKAAGAKIYSKASITRYFQSAPDGSTLQVMKDKYLIAGDGKVVILHRSAGLNSYIVLDSDMFTDL